MLYLGKLTEKNHTALAEDTGIMCSINLSSALVLVAKFPKPGQWSAGIRVTLTAECSMWTGLAFWQQPRGSCSWPCPTSLAVVLWWFRGHQGQEHPSHCPTLRNAMTPCAEQHQRALLGSGEVVASWFSDEMQISSWGQTFPALSGAAQAAGD